MQLARALELLAADRPEEGREAWLALGKLIQENEPEFQPYLDVYRVLEVTANYTGFRGLGA